MKRLIFLIGEDKVLNVDLNDRVNEDDSVEILNKIDKLKLSLMNVVSFKHNIDDVQGCNKILKNNLGERLFNKIERTYFEDYEEPIKANAVNVNINGKNYSCIMSHEVYENLPSIKAKIRNLFLTYGKESIDIINNKLIKEIGIKIKKVTGQNYLNVVRETEILHEK